MAVQKRQKKFGRIFCIYECLLLQTPINQGSQLSWFFQTMWKAIKKSKNRGLQGIISA